MSAILIECTQPTSAISHPVVPLNDAIGAEHWSAVHGLRQSDSQRSCAVTVVYAASAGSQWLLHSVR